MDGAEGKPVDIDKEKLAQIDDTLEFLIRAQKRMARLNGVLDGIFGPKLPPAPEWMIRARRVFTPQGARARQILESLCIDDQAVPWAYLPDIRAVLELVAREFKVAGEEKIARSIAISAS